MDVFERIRRGYRAVGPGAPRDVLAMFHQEQDDAPEWVIQDLADTGRVYETRDVVAMDLFGGLPAHWEVTGAELRLWDFYPRRSRLVVGGRFRTRPARHVGGPADPVPPHLDRLRRPGAGRDGLPRRHRGAAARYRTRAPPHRVVAARHAGGMRPRRSASPPSFQFHHSASTGSGVSVPAQYTAQRNT